ncbi:unnamed protein product [Absidia cylindrospora]
MAKSEYVESNSSLSYVVVQNNNMYTFIDAQTAQGHIDLPQSGSNEPPPAAVASPFVPPSSKEGDQNGVGPFLSVPFIENDITPTFTTPFSSPLITSSPIEMNNKTPSPRRTTFEEADHVPKRSWNIKGKRKENFLTVPQQDAQPPSRYSFEPGVDEHQDKLISKQTDRQRKSGNNENGSEENDYRAAYTPKTNNNDNEKNNWRKRHLNQVPPYPDRLRKELQLIETGKKSYSVPDFSILRHDWQQQQQQEQCQQNHHHLHYHHHYTLPSTPILQQQQQHHHHYYHHPMYQHHHQPPCHQQKNQRNKKDPDPDPQQQQQQHYHHQFNMTENDKQQFNHNIPLIHCHQHIPYLVSPCITKFPSLSSTGCSCYQ